MFHARTSISSMMICGELARIADRILGTDALHHIRVESNSEQDGLYMETEIDGVRTRTVMPSEAVRWSLERFSGEILEPLVKRVKRALPADRRAWKIARMKAKQKCSGKIRIVT